MCMLYCQCAAREKCYCFIVLRYIFLEMVFKEGSAFLCSKRVSCCVVLVFQRKEFVLH